MFNQTTGEATLPPLRPWHRQPGETPRQYEAFQLYLDGMTQVKVANKLYKRGESESKPLYKKPPGQIAKWASQNNWMQRRLAHTDHLNSVREEAVESQQQSQAVDWARRRANLDERIMNSSEKMIDRLNQILDSPLYEKRRVTKTETSAAGKTIISVTHMHPAKWAFGTAAQFLAIAKEAAEEVSSRQMAQAGEYGDASGEFERKLIASIEQAYEEENGGSSNSD